MDDDINATILFCRGQSMQIPSAPLLATSLFTVSLLDVFQIIRLIPTMEDQQHYFMASMMILAPRRTSLQPISGELLFLDEDGHTSIFTCLPQAAVSLGQGTFSASLHLGAAFPKAGRYTFEASCGGLPIGEAPLIVTKPGEW
jgi:hypothetical protein